MQPQRTNLPSAAQIRDAFGDLVERMDVLVHTKQLQITLGQVSILQPLVEDDPQELRNPSWVIAAVLLHSRLDKLQHILDEEDREAYELVGKMLAKRRVSYTHR